MADIVGILLDAGLKLFGLRAELSNARRERKQRVAEFLDSIGSNIENVSVQLKQGVYPHGACQMLLTHSQTMVTAIGDLVGVPQAKQLGDQLHEVWQIERLYSELASKSKEEKERSLHTLDQAAGLFRATAEIVKVSP